jgi:hypothetical protein
MSKPHVHSGHDDGEKILSCHGLFNNIFSYKQYVALDGIQSSICWEGLRNSMKTFARVADVLDQTKIGHLLNTNLKKY